MTTMKALVKAAPEAGLQMREVEVPVPGPDEVLVKVNKTAICGTEESRGKDISFAVPAVTAAPVVDICVEIHSVSGSTVPALLQSPCACRRTTLCPYQMIFRTTLPRSLIPSETLCTPR